jgi:hypothetical protein
VRSNSETPSASTTRASPRTSFAGCSARARRVEHRAGAPRRRDRSHRTREPPCAGPSTRGRSTPNAPHLGHIRRAESRCTSSRGEHHGAAALEVAVDALDAGHPTHLVDGVDHRLRIATAASKPCSRSSEPADRGNSAEHQPPLRPDAPNPAISRSSTAMRRPGSAFASEYAVQSPVSPPPTMQTSNRASA